MNVSHTARGLRLLVLTSLAIVALLLPASASAAPIVSPVESASNHGGCSAIHVVRRGDTLTKIARWYGVSVRALTTANNIHNPNRIYVGQRICIPGSGGQPPVVCTTWHTVRRGDTLSKIARWYGVSLRSLIQANNFPNPSRIYAGQKVCIPGGGGHPAQPIYSPQPVYPEQPSYPPPTPDAAPPPAIERASIVIRDFAFMPQTFTIRVGTTVTWTNQDSTPHTTTSDAGAWDSGQLDPGQSFSITFTQAGTYSFYCRFHPSMAGAIVVTN